MKNRDIIALLKQDHEKVRGLLKELEASTERGVRKRENLVQSIELELKMHTTVEEEIVYPAFKELVAGEEDESLYYEAREEHHVVDMVLPELKTVDPSSPEFEAKAMVLKELVEHHADEEEKEIFVIMRKQMEREQLIELAERVEARKAELMHQGFPRAKSTQRKRPSARAHAPN
jgi:hemerythrin-like domain-containing protein